MKIFRKFFSFLLILLALSSYGDDKKSPTATMATKSRIAFLVGINSYKATTSLKYAVGDSNAIEDLLLRTGKYDKLIKLTDQGKIITIYKPETDSYTSQTDSKIKPTKVNIETTYQEVLADNPDTLLFYYSGHGFIEGEGGENYIAPKDVDVKFEKRKVGKEEKQVPVPLNGISLKVMGIQATKVKRVVFLIDACRSPLPEADGEEEVQIADAGRKELTIARLLESGSDGGKDTKSAKVDSFKEAKSAKNAGDKLVEEKDLVRSIISVKTEDLPKRVLEAEGITMLIGAAPEVSSLEDEDFKSGIFTHFLKKAFNGGVQEENQEEYITEENLSRYIEDKFKDYYEKRKKETELAAEPKLYNLTFDRGKKGELLLTHHRPIEGNERIEKPIYTDTIRKREVKGKLVYNEKGEREDLRFFVHDKKRDLYYPDSLDGVYKMEYSFKKDKANELENFTATEFNLENQEVFEYGTRLIPDVGWEYRGLYNASGMDARHRKDLINQVPTMASSSSMLTQSDTIQIKFEAKIYDFNGNNISEEYFDSDGQPLEFEGVAKTVRAYDKDGQKILEEFYSKETLDEFGDVVEKGKLVAKDGFARYMAKYKSKGNLLLETWEDADGKVVNNQFGYSKIQYIYDKKDRLIQKKFYNSEKKPANDKSGVAIYQYSYNSDCLKFYEAKINQIKKEARAKSLAEWQLGKYNLCLAEEMHTNAAGKPANDEKQIYKLKRNFNQKGFLVSEESYRADGRRHLENGVARLEYSHDKEGNIISRKNFGEYEIKKKPVPDSDGNGVHEYRYTYQEYFNYDGKPVLNECIYYRKEKGILLAPYDCALKVEHFGINGKPIEDKRGVYRTSLYYTGAYQVEADRVYYATSGKFIAHEREVNDTYNPFGSNTLLAFYQTIEGKEILVNKKEYKYDERNNNTLEARYETINLVSKKEYKYDKRNNMTLEARYGIKEGKETLVEKYEYKYDERNNRTLEAYYDTIEGKETLVEKIEYKYDERNNITLDAYYYTIEGKETLVRKKEYKYDERNNWTLQATYEIKKGKETLVRKYKSKYDERNNNTVYADYEMKEGKETLVEKHKHKYDERNNRTLEAYYYTIEGKETLGAKKEYKYDERNHQTLDVRYEIKEGKETLVAKSEYKYDERNHQILDATYEIKEEKETLVYKIESKYDERNNMTLWARYETREGKETLVEKHKHKYDERNNKTLEARYATKEGKEVLVWKDEYKYDERNNKTLEARYETKEGKEVLVSKSMNDYRAEPYSNAVTVYEPQIKEIEEKISKTKDKSEKKSLTQKLEDLNKAFESKKKKYTLTEEKYGANEKLESASYKLLFSNPRGPADKRLMRVDLDRFYRPVGVGFEEE